MSPHPKTLEAYRKASAFLKSLRLQSEAAPSADDLLLFFYDLTDHFKLVQSRNVKFSGTLPNILKEIIYLLESSPDSALQEEPWKRFVESFLEELAAGRLIIAPRN